MATANLPVVGNNGPGTIQGPSRVQIGGSAAMAQTIEDLNTIRSFVRAEMKEGLDYGVIPGTGTKPTLLQPGAQKIFMYCGVYADYDVQTHELDGGHVEYIVKVDLLSRSSQSRVGAGLGSASTMESKYRWRKGQRSCPNCGAETIIKGKAEYGGGWVCLKSKGGCGAKYADNDHVITGQNVNRVENPDIYDARNTVLKMAKKRAMVDAAHGLGCMSELFTQDLEDFAPVAPAPHHDDEYASHARRDVNEAFDRPEHREPAPQHRPQQSRPAHGGQQSGQHGPPRSGKALFAWLRGLEQQGHDGLVKWVNSIGKDRGWASKMVEWDPSQVEEVVGIVTRELDGPSGRGEPSEDPDLREEDLPN